MLQGSLFTRYFLEEGIKETEAWQNLDDELISEFQTQARKVFESFPIDQTPNEARTEDDLIWKILGHLGWNHFIRQANLSVKGKDDVPDGLLFLDEEAKSHADKYPEDWRKYADGTAIVESKRWARQLDRKDARKEDVGVPSTQMLRYLRRLDDVTEGKVRWGVLTNGRHWRLYWSGAASVSEEFFEIDLPVILGLGGFEPDLFDGDPAHFLKVFYLIFRCEAFGVSIENKTFLHHALDEGKLWERRVAEDLSELVFDQVFPNLVRGLFNADPERPEQPDSIYLNEVRDGALILLYRLLFVLYAEDRNLLPVRDKRYDDYGMHHRVRREIADRIDQNDIFAAGMGPKYQHMQNLFRAISEGQEDLGLPPYNGGLFHAERVLVLERAILPDAVFAPIVDALSRSGPKLDRRWINYRDLKVRQLGSIYESLLEHEVVTEGEDVAIRPNIFARKGSGSYYTPDDLVRLIIERTLTPLLDERRAAFEEVAEALKSEKGPKQDRLDKLSTVDPANAFLDLKICDPAMGSGHFLVDLVDYMADQVLEALVSSEAAVEWAEYVSPVSSSIIGIRERILEQAKEHNWANINEDQLDDRQIVRRMILKRVIYGVDKNSMAVELAKVALWLHTFTVGAPLSFLDHHLRTGDSLFGEFVRPIEDELAARGDMFLHSSVQHGMNAAKGMMTVERMTDADIAEAKSSASTFEGVSEATAPLVNFLGLVHALRWRAVTESEAAKALDALLDGIHGDPMEIAAGGEPSGKKKEVAAFKAQLEEAQELFSQQHFLHWEVAFPGVWPDWESSDPLGGFDAIIGNPPWDRIKLQQVEWFAARRPEIAHAQRAADRKTMIEDLKTAGDPLYDDFIKARDLAESASKVARASGQYPLLSGGDTNLYSLFVERAQRLLSPNGVAGLLVPSGIASDKGASEFFKGISVGGHLSDLLDFENKKIFFPDVHASFKFCAFIAGGKKRVFDAANCAFFLHHVDEIETAGFTMGPADFSAVNPNTGTAPIFRSERDAELTKAIYARIPVLVDHNTDPPTKVFPVKYSTMFHMTNDSELFHTAQALEADGCYKIAGNRWKKGEEEFVPLYEGKMVQAFDHRAASVVINPSNLNRPAQPLSATIEQHCDIEWLPTPQFWVNDNNIRYSNGLNFVLGFKEITASTNERSMIVALFPTVGFGNKVPLLFPELSDGESENSMQKLAAINRDMLPLICANLNAFVFDFVTRQKVHGQTLNWFIVEQLPVLAAEAYNRRIGVQAIRDIVRNEVLKLTYTAYDMEPFARDMGYEGEPFIWDEEERRHSRARLDALYFILYGIERPDADYILSTFPIVQRQDQAEHGRYLTRDLILGYMAAFEAGDSESRIVI